jgi:RNA polymerase sigma-70 factor (ECF subfamily)
MLHVDKDLFAAAQAGDRAALERLLTQLRPDIQRYARFQCYASSSIEDVVQEALIVVYRRVGNVRSPAAFGAWLVRVGRAALCPTRADVHAQRRGTEDDRGFDALRAHAR